MPGRPVRLYLQDMGTFEGWPDWVEARPIEKTDVDAWAALLADVQKVDQDGENYSAEDLLEELGDPKLKAELDTIGLWADGDMVAYGVVNWRKNLVDVDRLGTDAAVRPSVRRRGLGRTLMTWMIDRANELHAEHHPDVEEAELNSRRDQHERGCRCPVRLDGLRGSPLLLRDEAPVRCADPGRRGSGRTPAGVLRPAVRRGVSARPQRGLPGPLGFDAEGRGHLEGVVHRVARVPGRM